MNGKGDSQSNESMPKFGIAERNTSLPSRKGGARKERNNTPRKEGPVVHPQKTVEDEGVNSNQLLEQGQSEVTSEPDGRGVQRVSIIDQEQ